MKDSTAGTNFEDIGQCMNRASRIARMCVRACAGKDNKIPFSAISPRSKYIYIKDGATANDVKEVAHKQGGNVFGLAIRIAQQYLKY